MGANYKEVNARGSELPLGQVGEESFPLALSQAINSGFNQPLHTLRVGFLPEAGGEPNPSHIFFEGGIRY